MRCGIVLFAGTTEGRRIAEMLAGTEVPVDICVATSYGASLLPSSHNIEVHTGRLDREELEKKLAEEKPELVVDATHPYAAVITENAEEACRKLDIPFMRIRRAKTDTHLSHALTVSSMEEAADFLDGTEGNILVTTGSKQVAALKGIRDYRKRCYARVLPMVSSIEKCSAIGLPPSHIIAMQGPFSERMNRGLIEDLQISWMLTKDSGEEGGCPEKISAAEKEGVGVVLVGRPEEPDEAIPLDRALQIIREEWEIPERAESGDLIPEKESAKDNGEGAWAVPGSSNLPRKEYRRSVALIGIGPGRMGLMTEEAVRYLCSADLLIGAGRMIDAGEEIRERYDPGTFSDLPNEKRRSLSGTEQTGPGSYAIPIADTVRAIRADEIVKELESRTWRRAAVLYSGDISRYSGAKALRGELEKSVGEGHLKDTEILTYNGISSVSYFLGKLGASTEDVLITSLHGREGSLVPLVRTHAKVLSLLGTGEETSQLAEKLLDYGLMDVRLTVGEKLSYDDEKITSGYPANFKGIKTEKLALLLIENPHPMEEESGYGLPDDAFLRSKVPMTKREIRSLSLTMMNIHRDSVVWDVGAGTGSISVEAAIHAPEGTVYAVEQKAEAVELIKENKRKFICDNLNVIEGTAPEALAELPAPDTVFVGGSSGNLKGIVNRVFDKNIDARIVITAVTTETLSELAGLRDNLPDGKVMEQTEIIAVRERTAGRYHLRQAESPVTIAVIRNR